MKEALSDTNPFQRLSEALVVALKTVMQ
jgi:hypothetical protein